MVIVHPNEVLGTGLAAILEGLRDPVQVALCECPRSALDLIEEKGADVVVMAAEAQDAAHQQRLAEHAARTGTKTLLLVKSADRETVCKIAAVPCDGVLVEEGITSAAIEEALSRCRRGDMPVPTTVLRGLLSEVRNLRDHGTATGSALCLTPREQATLELLVHGFSNKEIAKRLDISQHGAKRHVANILAKLNCPNRTLAAALAIREGLVEPP
ncbi:response regulator transcription factor [Nonomuraea sediminis]|uniref:response regulator transcription factor n=1 Tax=Nonomuraea sediminis TaxID=2835864 RepID=UPI001BDC124F|nr:response regulator transcription factor [Nonomuraea sediminis]